MTVPRFLLIRSNLIIVLMLLSCNSQKSLDIQGHRGCRGLYPENSIPAFKKAIELGVNTLELDIVVSKDRKVVVSHEPYMSSLICTKANGEDISKDEELSFNLFEMTFEEIQQFDCGLKYISRFSEQVKLAVKKPLLVEVFQLSKDQSSNVRFNIEIKSQPEYYGIYVPYPEEYVSLVMQLVTSYDMLDRVTIQSFDLNILEEVYRVAPEVDIALLVEENESISDKLKRLSFKPTIISPYFKLLNGARVKNYRNQEFKVIPWTVNSISDLKEVLSWEVDGIITDYPNRLIELVH